MKVVVIAFVILTLSCAKAEKPAPVAGAAPAAPAVTATSQAEPAGGEAVLGGRMPAYSGKLLDGSTFDMARESGNVVLINLWATWCGPCRYEIPELQKLHNELQSQRFKVVGVSVDEGAPEEVRLFVAEQKMTYPVVLDPEGKMADILASTVLPTTILVDRKGRVVWKKLGIVDAKDADLVKALELALKS